MDISEKIDEIIVRNNIVNFRTIFETNLKIKNHATITNFLTFT